MDCYRINLRAMDKSVRIPAYILRHYSKITGRDIETSIIDAKEMMIVEYSISMDLKKLNAHWLSNELISRTESFLDKRS